MKRVLTVLTLYAVFVVFLCSCSEKIEQITWQEQYDLGLRYLEDGNYKEAIIAFEAAIKIEPGNLDSYMRVSEACLSNNDESSAANALVRGYIATGSEELLWELISSISSQDILNSYYWIEDIPATYYGGEDPFSQALMEQEEFLSGAYAVVTDGRLTIFDEPIPIEICGESFTIEQANTSIIEQADAPLSFMSNNKDTPQHVTLSGYISLNTGLYRTFQLYEDAYFVEEDDGKRILIWTDEYGGEIHETHEYIPGGLWSLAIENMEVLP